MASTLKQRRRRGNAAITAIALTTLLGFGALAVDLAWVRVIDAQLAAALDAAAAGGAGYLDGTAEGVDLAVEKAVEIGRMNPAFVEFDLGPEDVLTGDWDEDTRTFTALPASEFEQIDALRVAVPLDGIPAILANVAFARRTLSTAGEATAWRPLGGAASEVPCFLPLVLPTCAFASGKSGANPPPFEVNLGDDKSDEVGWGMPGTTSAKSVRDQLENGCSAGSLSVGDEMTVQNGVVQNAVQTIGAILDGYRGSPEPWPVDALGPMYQRKKPYAFPPGQSLVNTPNWGNTLQGPIALVDLGGAPGSCAGAEPFNGTREVQGFTWGVLYDARGGDAKQTGFMIQLDFETEHEVGTDSTQSAEGNVTAPLGKPILVD